jgi:alpha-glucuronidase
MTIICSVLAQLVLLVSSKEEASWWRDASDAYFQSVSRRLLPPGYAPPAYGLEHYKALAFPYAPGQ